MEQGLDPLGWQRVAAVDGPSRAPQIAALVSVSPLRMAVSTTTPSPRLAGAAIGRCAAPSATSPAGTCSRAVARRPRLARPAALGRGGVEQSGPGDSRGGPTVAFAPRGPSDSEPPDLLRFSVSPGAILMRLQKRKAMLLSRGRAAGGVLVRSHTNSPAGSRPTPMLPLVPRFGRHAPAFTERRASESGRAASGVWPGDARGASHPASIGCTRESTRQFAVPPPSWMVEHALGPT